MPASLLNVFADHELPAQSIPSLSLSSNGTLEVIGSSVSGVELKSGDPDVLYRYMNIASGGTATETVIAGGGTQTVFSGGIAAETLIADGGTQIIAYSGIASETVIASVGTQFISSGGVAHGTVLKDMFSTQSIGTAGVTATAISITVNDATLGSVMLSGSGNGNITIYGDIAANLTAVTTTATGGVMAVTGGATVNGGVNLSLSNSAIYQLVGVNGGGAVSGGVSLAVSGTTTMANVIGGQANSSIGGDLSISVSGSLLRGIVVGTSGNVGGDLVIVVENTSMNSLSGVNGSGTVTGDIRLVLRGADCSITHSISAGNSTAISGNDRILRFEEFSSGAFANQLQNFSRLEFADSDVTFSGTYNLSAIESWSFDVSGRSASDAGSAMVNWSNGSNSFAGDAIELYLDDAQYASGSWSLMSGSSAIMSSIADAGSFKVHFGDNDAVELAWGSTVAGGDYDGWGFSLDNNVLKFGLIA